MAEVELAVMGFPRRLKFTVGARLSCQAHEVALAANRAWRGSEDDSLFAALGNEIDSLKLRLQLAQQLQSFKSFGQFEALARGVSNLGRQYGGWQKKRTSMRQNVQSTPLEQRPPILSSRAASSEANI